VKIAVSICNKITGVFHDKWSAENKNVPLIDLEPDSQYPEIYLTTFSLSSNTKASLLETKIVSALLHSGLFESLYPPFQDTVATCYYFKTTVNL
jgi:hypothetical protein